MTDVATLEPSSDLEPVGPALLDAAALTPVNAAALTAPPAANRFSTSDRARTSFWRFSSDDFLNPVSNLGRNLRDDRWEDGCGGAEDGPAADGPAGGADSGYLTGDGGSLAAVWDLNTPSTVC